MSLPSSFLPSSSSAAWVPVLQGPPDPTARLLCFPYAGAGPVVFRPWIPALPPGVQLRAVQLPGRAARLREPYRTRLPAIVDALEEILEPLLDRPVVLFGHSLGGLIAFETARRLQARGRPPAHLFVSGKVAPDRPEQNRRLHALAPDEFLTELQQLNGIPAPVLACRDLLDLVLPAVRADFEVLETYQFEPAPPLACPLTVFGGSHDPRTTPEGLAAWQAHTVGAFEHFTLPGDHFFLDSARPRILDVVTRALRHLTAHATP